VIAEAGLDAESIFEGIVRFARERENRLERQRQVLADLKRPAPSDRAGASK